MRSAAGAASIFVFAVSLALPGLLMAQEPVEPAPPAPAPPAEEAPPAPPPDPATPPTSPPPEPAAPPPVQTEVAETTAAPPPVAKGAATVSMVDYAFSPATVTVNPGDTVTWINSGEEDHDAVGSGFSTGTVSPGGSGAATFSSAGSFAYVCSFHPDMKGTVVVNDTSAGGPTTEDGTTIDPETGAPIGSEEAAGAAAGAAGSADALPASGEPEAPLVVFGVGLLGCGLMATALARWRSRETALLPPAL